MLTDADRETYLASTPTIQSTHPAVLTYVEETCAGARRPLEAAVRLYYAVRDDIRYDPYRVDLSEAGVCASATLAAGYGWCVSKAVLLAACCRASGIPARLGYADVRNHLSTARMRESMQTDVFYWHGYTSIYLDGEWVKATPAFNLSLCQKFGLEPLEFDGRTDSLFHAFDTAGNRHMEYIRERGEFADLPLAEMSTILHEVYPSMIEFGGAAADAGADFERDVEAETA